MTYVCIYVYVLTIDLRMKIVKNSVQEYIAADVVTIIFFTSDSSQLKISFTVKQAKQALFFPFHSTPNWQQHGT